MSFTRTKIICTIGPATETISALKKLHNNGMNVARINMSHATHKSAKAVIDRNKNR
jgi:pyruvate kinase